MEAMETSSVQSEPQEPILQDFMDIVMSYKCKFCEFTSPQPQHISQHVRATHLVSSLTIPAPTQPAVPQTADVVSLHGSVQLAKAKDDDGQTLVICQDIAETPSNEVSVQTGVGNYIQISAAPSASGNSPNSVSFLPAKQNQKTPCSTKPVLPPKSCVSTSTETEASRAVNEISLEVAGPSASADIVHQTSAPPPVTRELYLCGQCSIGFNSVEDCKVHMIQVHNAILPTEDAALQPEDDVQAASEKVSVGTQVATRKKPGRKPKGYYVEPEPPEPEPMEYVTVGTRSRPRRVAQRKANRDDFYIARTKIKSRDTSHMSEYTIKCDREGCVARFKNEQSLSIHKRCHRPGDFCFNCCECNQPITKWREVRFHLWRFHRIDTDLLMCDRCNFRTDVLHKLKVHQQIHSDDRPYKCDLCEKGFKQLAQLHNHRSVHDDPVPAEHYSAQCEICRRNFRNQKCLVNHVEAIHTKSKPLYCTFCEYTTCRKAMLQLHLRTHTGEKPFKCDHCQYVTGDHNSLRRHRMRHTGEKPYKCQYCPYSCIQAISLKCHMKNRHPGMAGVYWCEICQFRTINKDNYDKHMNLHQLGLISLVEEGPVPSDNQVANTNSIPSNTSATATCSSTNGATSVSNGVELSTSEAQISREDLAKLTANYEGLMPSDVSAAQLIYSALNAMSQSVVQPSATQASTHVLEGVQTTISAGAEEGGITTHTITFHLATPENQASVGEAGSDQTTPLILTPTGAIQLVDGTVPSDASSTDPVTVNLQDLVDSGQIEIDHAEGADVQTSS